MTGKKHFHPEKHLYKNMNLKVRDLTYVGVAVALMVVGAAISIPIGPVPISLQSLFALIIGIVLGKRLAPLAMIIYIAAGLMGLPFFAGFRGGPQYIISPTFGFIMGFVCVAFIAGRGNETNSKYMGYISLIISTIVLYVIGAAYFYLVQKFYIGTTYALTDILRITVIPFIIGDFVKLNIAYIVGRKLKAAVASIGFEFS